MTPIETQNRPSRRRQADQCCRPGRYGLARNPPPSILVVGFCFWAAHFTAAQVVTFNFDTGTPALTPFQNLPVSQTAGGVIASFNPAPGSFSIQTDVTTGYKLSQFSGNYLFPNHIRGDGLRIQFSRALTDIAFTFATTEYPASHPQTTPIVMTAFATTSTATNVVGSVTQAAAYGTNTYPMGTLAFNSGSNSFNRVEVRIQTGGDAAFLVDNVTATPLPQLDIWLANTNTVVVSWPSPSTGFLLQQQSALGAASWVGVTNTVEVVDGQNQVTVSPAMASVFYRLIHL